jgi:hypothetical protein
MRKAVMKFFLAFMIVLFVGCAAKKPPVPESPLRIDFDLMDEALDNFPEDTGDTE